MKKVELQELIQDFLAGGDAPSDVKGRYHDEIILNHMENAYGAIVFQTWMEAKNYSDYSVLDAWGKNYPITITDVVGTGGIAVLPFPPMQLPDNRGILQVCPQADLTNPFIYLETNAQGVYAALEVSTVLLKPSFYLEQRSTISMSNWILANGYWDDDGVWDDDAYWIDDPINNTGTHQLVLDNIPDGVGTLKVKMIVPLSVIDLYDEVALPSGKEDMMIKEVVKLFRSRKKRHQQKPMDLQALKARIASYIR